jgi:hypothetical protein
MKSNMLNGRDILNQPGELSENSFGDLSIKLTERTSCLWQYLKVIFHRLCAGLDLVHVEAKFSYHILKRLAAFPIIDSLLLFPHPFDKIFAKLQSVIRIG